MLQIDLPGFARAARWERLPVSIAARHFEQTAVDPLFPGALLPAVDATGQTYWYAVAQVGTQWRQLEPLLKAYAGPTLTNFIGRAQPPDQGVPAEAFLAQAGFQTIAVLKPGRGCLEFTASALERLRAGIAARRAVQSAVPESTSRLLTQFEMCLATGARPEAEQLLSRLRAELRLDTLNLHFLQVRLLATFRDWKALVGADWFVGLCDTRKPALIAGLMLEALWQVHFLDVAEDPRALQIRYRERMPDPARRLLAQAAPDADGIIARLRALESPPAALSESPGIAAQELLDQAAEAPEITRLEDARAAIDALSAEVRHQLVQSAAGQSALEQLDSLEGPLPQNWLAWLEALSQPNFHRALDVARDGVIAWPAQNVTSALEAAPLAQALIAVGLSEGPGAVRLAESVPILIRWVKEDPGYPRQVMAPLYEALLQLFAILDRRDDTVRSAAADLLDAILTVGTPREEYRRVLTDFESLVDEGAGDSSIYFLIDVAASLLAHPSPDDALRLTLLNRILNSMQPLLSRCTTGQRAAYQGIASGAGWPALAAPPESATEDGLRRLDGQSIAIYTLTESAARQAEGVLRALLPNSRIELAHDQVASARLIRLARDADVFVLAAASAKHAASDCILANRSDREVLYPMGRGFSSIVRALEEHAQNRAVVRSPAH